jgi:hypothetical protein
MHQYFKITYRREVICLFLIVITHHIITTPLILFCKGGCAGPRNLMLAAGNPLSPVFFGIK